jgi:hypothetical protein
MGVLRGLAHKFFELAMLGVPDAPAHRRKRLHLRLSIAWLAAALLSSCALQNEVRRFSVDYNTAVSSMSNQLTLLNIVRAKEGLPTYYTSISRLTGSISVQAGAGLSAQLKEAAPTTTNSTTTQSADTNGTTITNTTGSTGSVTTTSSSAGTSIANAAGTSASLANAAATTASSTVTNLVQTAVAKGGNIYAPSISGQVTSSPAFDIDILDTQEFYQGILAQISSDTVETYADQGIDQQLLARLLIQRIVFKAKDEAEKVIDTTSYPDWPIVGSMENVASGDQAKAISELIACSNFTYKTTQPHAKKLAPLSRITKGQNESGTIPLKVSDLAQFDDTKLTLSRSINEMPKDDSKVFIEIPGGSEKTTIELRSIDPAKYPTQCYEPNNISDISATSPKQVDPGYPLNPPPLPVYWNGKLKLVDKKNSVTEVPVTMEMIFRSPEGVVKFLGEYLRSSEEDPDNTYGITFSRHTKGPCKGDGTNFNGDCYQGQSRPLFSVKKGHESTAIVSVSLDALHEIYYIANDSNKRENMMILGLVEQLINLQKSALTRPVTIPVQVVP